MKGGLYVLAGLLFILASLWTLFFNNLWSPFWDYIVKGGLTAILIFGGIMLLFLWYLEWQESRKQGQSSSSSN